MIVQTYSKEAIDQLVDSLERVQRALRMRMAEGNAARLVVKKRDARIEVLELILRKLLSVEGDHMTACDRTMGATHPCTCGANRARSLLTGDDTCAS